MIGCKKCWNDAEAIALHTGRAETEHYLELLLDKTFPCSKKEKNECGYSNENCYK